jgi:hypothetical protein
MFNAIASLIKGLTTGDWRDFKGDSSSNKQGCLSWFLATISAFLLGLITQNYLVGIISFFILFIVYAIIFKPKK